MRRKLTPVLAGLSLLIPFTLAGCKLLPVLGGGGGHNTPLPQSDKKADVPSLVNYLNQNASRVKDYRAQVDIDARQGRNVIGLGGLVACRKPLDFRLKAKVLGKDAVDIGSNNDRFWYWISEDNPPHVYHCGYKDLSSGKVRMAFPFDPEMVIAAMGIAEYDPDGKYELRETQSTVELIQDVKSADGQSAKRITVFNRYQAAPGKPQVLAHVLQDTKGNMICKASVQKVQIDRTTNAVLPSVVTIEWPAQKMSLKLMMSGIETNVLDADISKRLFSMSDLDRLSQFDLARGIPAAGGTRRAEMRGNRQ